MSDNVDILSISKLSRLCNPFVQCCWHGLDRPLTEVEVRRSFSLPPGSFCRTRDQHAGRIKWFLEYGWKDPISVDVGVPGLCEVVWPIVDGNHRFAAALLNGDMAISAYCSGSVKLLDGIRF